MFRNRATPSLILLALLWWGMPGRAQAGKGHEILLNRGLQVQGMVTKDDGFHLSTYTNANYSSIHWLWESNPSLMGAAPGFAWSRWALDETKVPPQGSEGAYMSQLVTLQLGDEWHLNDDAVRTRAVNWFSAIRSNFPNTILYMNSWGGQVTDGPLGDFVVRAQPDMLCFDKYPWKSDYATRVPIGGPPTSWYSELRRYREHARAANIPFGCYVQTFHAVEDYSQTVYRDPSASELRLNHFGALVFNAKALIDFTYNTGASSLFTAPGGDSHTNALYLEKTDIARRIRHFGPALLRLKPIADVPYPDLHTTSMMVIRGKEANGAPNPIPIGFVADPEAPDSYTDWVADRNDPNLRGWVVTNLGTKNNGQPGDVIISWFKPLDESFDGPDHTNEIYLMIVNGLTATNGTAGDCVQEIKLDFQDTFPAIERLNSLTGNVEVQGLPVVNTRRQLVLSLNGGDAALFKVSDGAPFVGGPVVGPPVITQQPAGRTIAVGTTAAFEVLAGGALPLRYQWQFNRTNIAGATTNSYARTNVQLADSGVYTVVVTNTSGSVTSAPATLTVVSNLLVLYELFDYTNIGGPVTSNTPVNWAYGGTGTNDLNVAAGSLTHSGLAESVGNSVTNGGPGLGVRRLFGASISNGLVYFSALFRVNDLGFGAWNGAGTQAGALTATDSSTVRLAVMLKSNSPSGYVLGAQKGGAGATAVFDATEHHANETIFLVGKYDFNTSPNAVTLWINPDPATFGLAAEPGAGFISANTGTDGYIIDRFNMRQNTAASVPAAMQWDELRVGRLWSDVTPVAQPEPPRISSFMLLDDGSFQLAYSNANGPDGNIYASTNLTNWAAVGVATQFMPAVYQFTDWGASNHPHRFYQIRSP